MQDKDYSDILKGLKGKESDVTDEQVGAAVEKLSGEQKKRLGEILSSPEKIREILSSGKAAELRKKLGK